jgi:hypothetical protein
MRLLVLLLAFSLTLPAFAVTIEEELFVPNQRPEVVKEILSTGSAIVDHVSEEGFELYGPKGLSRYLDERGILHFDQQAISQKILLNYPSYNDLTRKLQELAARKPEIMKLTSIGKSAQGRELWVMKVSDNVDVDEVEPEFKYISSMHGDEITGRELTMFFLEEIAEKYGTDPEITALVNNTEIFIMPSMNPDGSERRSRANARGKDLNRNFPNIIRDTQSTTAGREPETQAVMNFQASRQFALSANFHGGAVVANYPWDSTYDRHPLDALAQELSTIYAEKNSEMINSRNFPGGIVNGADWYVVEGGMQDWSYFWFNDLQITIELSDQKWPAYSAIPGFYQRNRDSMVAFMKEIHRGAGFRLARKSGRGSVQIRQISPQARDLGTYAFRGGEFYKVLPIGEYEFVVSEAEKSERTIKVSVQKDRIVANGNYRSLR